jgi:hypothetical protein
MLEQMDWPQPSPAAPGETIVVGEAARELLRSIIDEALRPERTP